MKKIKEKTTSILPKLALLLPPVLMIIGCISLIIGAFYFGTVFGFLAIGVVCICLAILLS